MKITFTLIVLFFSVELIAQKAGTLDYSFGDSGKVITSSSTGYLACTGGGLQSDGSIIAAGGVSFDNSNTDDFFAIKYSSNGAPDSSFGKKGLAVLKGLGEAQTQKVQLDNKIIVAGYNTDLFGTYYAITAGRLNADGSVDSAFGTDGSITNNAGESCSDIALQPDGKILFTGGTGIAFITLRYLPDGTLDNSFGNNGSVTTNFGNGTPKKGTSNVVQPDGKIVVAGGDNERIMMARYNIDGSLDETFGNNGEVISDISHITYSLNIISDMIVQPDGKLVLSGTTSDGILTNKAMILRYMPNGSLDTTFGENGIVVNTLQYNSSAFNLALQQDSKVIICGYAIPDGVNSHFLVERYNTNGTIDSAFGNDGYQITVMDISDGAETALLQQDGKIVLAGAAYNNQDSPASYEVALARYNNDDESKKQIIITKIRRWVQQHNGIEWDNTGSVKSYAVQRSADGVNWQTVYRSPFTAHNYNDPAPLNGTNYYRLQTTSTSNAVANSNVIAISNDDNIKVSPNPAQSLLHIEGLSSTQKTKITVIDFNGNVKLQTVANASSYNLNIAQLHAGNYMLKIETNDNVVTKQFVKE